MSIGGSRRFGDGGKLWGGRRRRGGGGAGYNSSPTLFKGVLSVQTCVY